MLNPDTDLRINAFSDLKNSLQKNTKAYPAL